MKKTLIILSVLAVINVLFFSVIERANNMLESSFYRDAKLYTRAIVDVNSKDENCSEGKFLDDIRRMVAEQRKDRNLRIAITFKRAGGKFETIVIPPIDSEINFDVEYKTALEKFKLSGGHEGFISIIYKPVNSFLKDTRNGILMVVGVIDIFIMAFLLWHVLEVVKRDYENREIIKKLAMTKTDLVDSSVFRHHRFTEEDRNTLNKNREESVRGFTK